MNLGIESVESATKIIKGILITISKSKKVLPSQIFNLCQAMSHYREIVFFSRSKVDAEMMNTCRTTLLDSIEGLDAPIVSIVLETIGFSYIPFVRGDSKGVYEKLMQGEGFSDYFDGVKKALVFFEKSAAIDTATKFSASTNKIKDESYSVWSRYSSEYHLSDILYSYFLNSELKFREIVAMNDSYLNNIKGLADEWKEK